MPKLEDNSLASRNAKQKELERREHTVEKVTSGMAKKQKKTLSKKVIDALFDQKVDEAIDYAKHNVIGPGIRRLIFDAFMGGLSMIFFGDAGGFYGGDPGGRTGGGRRGYDRIYDSRNGRAGDGYRRRSSVDVSDILFETREDAERVLDRLYRDLQEYGRVRVADLYSAAGVSGNSMWTDNNYGWFNLDRAAPYPTSEGWQLDMPPAESLR